MTFLVGFLKIGDGEFDVVTECIQVLVPEQFLDMVHVGATPNQFGCATSPEGMRGHVDIQTCCLGVGMNSP